MDRHGRFSFPGTGLGRNGMIFGVDISSSTKIDSREKYILILDKHTLSAEKMYSINLTGHNKNFCLNLH